MGDAGVCEANGSFVAGGGALNGTSADDALSSAFITPENQANTATSAAPACDPRGAGQGQHPRGVGADVCAD